MAHIPELVTRYQILSRHVASLSSELDLWIERASATGSPLEKNVSHIVLLREFMRTICRLNEESLDALGPSISDDVFLDGSLKLSEQLIKSQVLWDFFRDRLELRFVPHFQRPLRMADLISWDCYTRIMDRARALQIVSDQVFHEYPLVGLFAEFSPATWPRGWQPPALRSHNLPVPVIDLPWDHLFNPWELLTIAHEVAHDADEDLGKLTNSLQSTVGVQLHSLKASEPRITQWQRWTNEIGADLVAILLTGPAFVKALSGLLTMPKYCVRRIAGAGAHPPPYLRVLVNTALIRRLGLPQFADTLETRWMMLYGEPEDDFDPYLPEVEPVVSTIIDTPLAALEDRHGKRHCISEMITFSLDDQECIQEVAEKLVDRTSLPKVPIRYVVSASQFAFEQIVQAKKFTSLNELAQDVQQAIIDLSPSEQLPAEFVSKHTQKRFESLATELLDRPLSDFGVQEPGLV